MLPKWNLSDIRSRMFNRPLMVTRDKALDGLAVMGPRLDVAALFEGGNRRSMDDLKTRLQERVASGQALPGDDGLKKLGYDPATDSIYEKAPFENWNGAAIFQVRGTLMAENGLDPASGATGYDGLSKKVRWAKDDPAVLGAILDIDSPGGEVVDLLEVCNHLREFAAEKPLRAVVRGCAASAGYALAACAGKGNITAAPYSIVGSIGAIMLHADFSQQLEQEGIDVTIIASADHKADASQLKPLDDEVRAKLDAMVQGCARDFMSHVADARGVSVDSLAAQEARFYSDQEALSMGLVDKFMPWDSSMIEFAEGLNRRGSRSGFSAPTGARSAGKANTMSNGTPAPAAEQQQPETSEAAITAARAEGRTEGVEAGAAAERQRIGALATIAGATIPAALQSAIDDGTEPGDFAVAQAQAKAGKVSDAAAAAKSDAVSQEELPEGSAQAAAPAAKPEGNRGKAYAAKKQAAAG